MKTGLIDVGGGMRGIYAAGVLDCCLDEKIDFDLCIGVSAGSANIASFLAGQKGRNYKFYTEYAFRKEYMSLRNFVHTGNFVDLDYVYGTLSNTEGEYPVDFEHFTNNPSEFIVVATNAYNGLPEYFYKKDVVLDHYDVFKASSDLPFFCQPYDVEGTPYYDGGISDPIPVEKAFEEGCDKVVVLLTRPKDYIRDPKKDNVIAGLIHKEYPEAADKLKKRYSIYNDQILKLKKYAEEGKVLIISPDDTCGVDTLVKDKEALDKLYHKGYEDAKVIREFLK